MQIAKTEFVPSPSLDTRAREARTDSETPDVPVAAMVQGARADAERGGSVADSHDVRGTIKWVDDGKKAVYQLTDEKTGEILCQIPSNENLRLARHIADVLDSVGSAQLDLES